MEITLNYPSFVILDDLRIAQVDKVWLSDDTFKTEKVLVHDQYLNYECLEGDNVESVEVLMHNPHCINFESALYYLRYNEFDVDSAVSQLFVWGLTEVYKDTAILDVKTYLTRVIENYMKKDSTSIKDFEWDDAFFDRKRCIWID